MFGFWDWVGGRYSYGLGDRPVADDRDRPGRLPARCWPASTPWTSTSAPRRSSATCRCCMGAAGRLVPQLLRRRRPTPSCPTATTCRGSPPTSSSSTWSPTASRSTSTATRSTARPARSCGARPAPTASTPTTSCSTRARRSSRPTSSASPSRATTDVGDHHDLLMANLFAQAEALAFGKTARGGRGRGRARRARSPHRTFRRQPADHDDPGHRADAVGARRSWSPCTSTRCSSRAPIWGINSFDQWGVELGKVLAARSRPSSPLRRIRRPARTIRRPWP